MEVEQQTSVEATPAVAAAPAESTAVVEVANNADKPAEHMEVEHKEEELKIIMPEAEIEQDDPDLQYLPGFPKYTRVFAASPGTVMMMNWCIVNMNIIMFRFQFMAC